MHIRPGSRRVHRPFRRRSLLVEMAGAAILSLAIGSSASGATPPSASPSVIVRATATAQVQIGSLRTFGVLAGGGGVTNTGSTVINGDVGSPAALLGFPPGRATGTIHTGAADLKVAGADLVIAFQDAGDRIADAVIPGGTLGGTVLASGVYAVSGTMTLTGTMTLDGRGDLGAVWIFQAANLVTASTSRVQFVGGAQPCNVFWQVAGSAVLGADSNFAGTILAGTSITMGNDLELVGRAIARHAGVVLKNDLIVKSACARAGPTAAPAAVPVATAIPTMLPNGPAGIDAEPAARVAPIGQGFGSGPTAIVVLVTLLIMVFATRRWWRPIRLRSRGRSAAEDDVVGGLAVGGDADTG